MSACNYCTLRGIKARNKGKQVRVLYDATWGMGGCNVYVFPKGLKIANTLNEDDPQKKKYRVAWFQELPEKCVC